MEVSGTATDLLSIVAAVDLVRDLAHTRFDVTVSVDGGKDVATLTVPGVGDVSGWAAILRFVAHASTTAALDGKRHNAYHTATVDSFVDVAAHELPLPAGDAHGRRTESV